MERKHREVGSSDVARAAIRLAISANMEEERAEKSRLLAELGIRACGVDFCGDFLSSTIRIIERAIVAAKRENVILEQHNEVGGVAGATREALQQVSTKAMGLSVGGKIGIARYGTLLSVCVYFGVGLVHLNEVAIGLGHRAI